MELFVLGLFCVILLMSVTLHFPLVAALFAGLILFITYAAARHFSPHDIMQMILSGIRKASNILITFILIGMMTAIWRAAGTIPSIVSYSANLLLPQMMVIMAFLLCSLVSFLTGTSFGTGATMGVICASVGLAMNISPIMLGGAILSGCYFGDRCSPVSTSMLLTASLTETESYTNIKNMFRTSVVPFAAACTIYLIMGFCSAGSGEIPDMTATFSTEFVIHPVTLLPAAVILILAIMHMPIKRAMLISIAIAALVCIFLQGRSLPALVKFMLTGFRADHAELSPLIDGGGITSMLKCVAIVCISSAYAGIFEKTGLLNGIKKYITLLAAKTNCFTAVTVTSVLTSMAACNQTLSIMLTHQLCSDLPDFSENKESFALCLENTVVIIAPLIPWSIAGSTVLNSSGVPVSGILLAVYLYLIPLWGVICSFRFTRFRGTDLSK